MNKCIQFDRSIKRLMDKCVISLYLIFPASNKCLKIFKKAYQISRLYPGQVFSRQYLEIGEVTWLVVWCPAVQVLDVLVKVQALSL